MYTHNLNHSIWYSLNTVMFFIFFLGARIVFMTYIIFALGFPNLFGFFRQEGNQWWGYAIMIEGTVAVALAMLINFYWMYLIAN